MQRLGYFRLTLYGEALPVNMNSGLWDWDTTGNPPMMDESSNTQLISYRELVDMWEMRKTTRFGKFEELLLVACKGTEAVNEVAVE